MFILPIHKLRPDGIKADVVPRVISGGVALNDEEDVIQTDGGGRWEISFSGITLNTIEKQRLWDAWTSYLAGGARAVLVPVYSLRTAPRPIAGNGLMRPSRLIADDDVFPTSVAFASPYIVAQVVNAVALRATTMTIRVDQGARVTHGMRFGVGGRAYKIERVLSRAGMQAVCVTNPPAREPITAGSPAIFDWPLVQCTAAIGQDLAPEMQWARFGGAGISFVEDFSNAA